MTLKRSDWKGLRISKNKIIKYGRRSIYDIIKDKELDFGDKIDYIRHHYVYYDGNYEYFHDERGKSNEEKIKLNQLISLIVQRLADPSELKIINRQVMEWRREKKLAEKQALSEELAKINSIALKTPYEMKVNTWFNNWISMYDYTKLAVIREYLLAHDKIYENETLDNCKYKELKIKAFAWKNQQQRLLCNSESNDNGDDNAKAI